MADIQEELQKFKSARYGEEVRSSLISSITKMNDEITSDTESAKLYSTLAQSSAESAANSASQSMELSNNLQGLVSETEELIRETSTAETARKEAEREREKAEVVRESTEQGYVAQAKAYMEQTKSYANSNYVTEAQSWAVGGTNTRAEEDTNNAKYWASQAASIAGGNSVLSFKGRTGMVEPISGDYSALQITYEDSNVGAVISGLLSQITALKNACPYAVGDVYVTFNNADPSTKWAGTTWKKLENTFLYAESGATANKIGGNATHALTNAELPSHFHGIATSSSTSSSGGYQPNWHMQVVNANGVSNNGNNGAYAGMNTGGQSDRNSYKRTGDPFSIMPPYTSVFMWKRTA